MAMVPPWKPAASGRSGSSSASSPATEKWRPLIQNRVASSTLSYTCSRQSAALTTTSGSPGAATGRAPGLSLR